jgi:hypothetical protein
MRREHRFLAAWALVLAGLTTAGCSSSIVGEWQGEAKGKPVFLTILSDGTGDVSEEGQPTRAITWKRVDGKFEIACAAVGMTLEGTLRENQTLAITIPTNPDEGLLVLRRKTGDR